MPKVNAYSGANRQHSFSMVPAAEQSRSSFDRSSNYKTTLNAGRLVPFFVEEILPGDTVSLTANVFARMSTPIYPILDNLHLDVQFFFCPNRLVWNNWAYFMGEEETPGDAQLAPKYSIPQLVAPAGGWQERENADYMGIPTRIAGLSCSALPFRMMNLIWNEWYRDENLQPFRTVRKDGGVIQGDGSVPVVDLFSDYPDLPRGKRHDYYTSALPWPQKGPSVLLPLSGTAPVIPADSQIPTFSSGSPAFEVGPLHKNGSGLGITAGGLWTSGTNADLFWGDPNLQADLANASGATINELRQSFQIQRLLERDARGGSRLTELIRSHFGVTSPDARLQRPEYLGGGTINISVNPVPQTSGSAGAGGYTDTPQGNLSAFVTAAGSPGGFSQSFTEHGYVIGFVSIRADLNYQNALQRHWSRKTRFDFYWPALQNIGEQAILNKEIYAQGTSADDEVFGFQERWGEYRFRPNIVTSDFRSNSPTSLDAWHLAQEFTALPTLSAAFIEEKPPVDRVIAVQNEPQFLLDAFFKMKHARCMPVYSVPGLIDHF